MAKIKVKRKKKKAAETNIDMSVAKGGDLTNVLCDAIHRKFGKESILKMSQAPIQVPIITSSGIPRLDAILGRGGFPRGRLIEVIGPESSGKTTLCLHTIAAAQKDHNATAAFIDAEHALDPAYARNLDVNSDSRIKFHGISTRSSFRRTKLNSNLMSNLISKHYQYIRTLD